MIFYFFSMMVLEKIVNHPDVNYKQNTDEKKESVFFNSFIYLFLTGDWCILSQPQCISSYWIIHIG